VAPAQYSDATVQYFTAGVSKGGSTYVNIGGDILRSYEITFSERNFL